MALGEDHPPSQEMEEKGKPEGQNQQQQPPASPAYELTPASPAYALTPTSPAYALTPASPSQIRSRQFSDQDVTYQVVEQQGKKTTTREEVCQWATTVAGGQVKSVLNTNGEPYGSNDMSPTHVKVGSPHAHIAEEDYRTEDSSQTDTSSTHTEDWLDEEDKVHWKWSVKNQAIVSSLATIMLLGIGLFAATTPVEKEGAPFPHNAHLISTSKDHPGIFHLGQGQPNAIIEALFWVQPHEHALEHALNHTAVLNVTVEKSATNEEGSWTELDFHSFILEFNEEAKDYEAEFDGPDDASSYTRLVLETDSEESLPLALHVVKMRALGEYRVLYAALILLFEYTLIVFELIDRTVAAMVGSFVALVVLGLVKERPNLEMIINWIDFETVLLLFGMMVMVRIFSLTGVFEYCAVRAYKLSKGEMWRLTWIFCTFTAVTSAFLDNVTTMLLLTPVTCRLCKILKLDPTNLLLAEVMFSNIGGAATAVGDPPNIIIVNDNEITAAGIEFAEFTLHMFLGIICVFAGTMPFLKWHIRDFLMPPKQEEKELDEEELRKKEEDERRIKKLNLRNSFCQESAPKAVENDAQVVGQLSYDEQEKQTYSRNHPRWNIIELHEGKDNVAVSAFHVKVEVDHYKHNVNNDLLKRILIDNVQKMESEIRVSEISGALQLERTFAMRDEDGFEAVVKKMEDSYKIRYQSMFVTVGLVLLVAILLFFLHSAVEDIQLNLAWIAILGGMVALVVSGIYEPEKHVFSHVEWGTLLFFAALFVLMEALNELGLIDWIGDRISELIDSVDGTNEKMSVAIVVLLWVSAFASAFIDNIPYTTAMVPVIINVAESTGLPLKPLVFALAFGTCLGGNGTLIGASANVVTVGIAKEAYGQEISFVRFMKFGLPVMVLTITIATVYLLIVHPLAGWNM